MFVCYAIKCAPCSGNAERQKQQHGQSIAERRQGDRLRRACLACLIAFAIGAYCFIMRGLMRRGYIARRPGGTFSVRMDEGEELNRSCSSPNTLVPRQKTSPWQRENYGMGIFMTKTLQGHNPQRSCFLLLGYKQVSRK